MTKSSDRVSIFDECLFRYRKINDNNLNALIQNKLFFSTASNFNDPYDNLIYVNKDKLKNEIMNNWMLNMDSYIAKLEKESPIYASFAKIVWYKNGKKNMSDYFDQLDIVIDEIIANFRDKVKVICFCKNLESILMWSHYTENHKGFALVYDKNDINVAKRYSRDDNEINNKIVLSEVIYTNERMELTDEIHDYILKYAMQPREKELLNRIPDISQTKIRKFMLTKSTEWAYEQEFRLLPRVINMKEGSDLHYIEVKPKAIVLGAQCKEEDKHALAEICQAKSISIFKSELLQNEYKLKIKSLY